VDSTSTPRPKRRRNRQIEKPDGLYYEIDLPANDPLTAELVARGDLAGASFAFSVRPGGAKWDQSPNGMAIRIISAADLHEVSLVSTPAYPSTTAMLTRSKPPTKGETASLVAAAQRRLEALDAEERERARAQREVLEVQMALRERVGRHHADDGAYARARRR
jgi:phage head maturation protease